jgi:Tol biopolymer transport system component
MPLAVGSSLGAYEILAPLGAGGMGEVYRARDTRLARDVAVKILADRFFADAESLARFRREAQLLAALNHPNIATIHAIEEQGPTRFLVLELVDGDTLDRLLVHGPLHVDQTLEIASQIIAALDAAHEQGIVHRDLKPSNIALTKSGVVKVLDFGLAKREDRSALRPADIADSPTITASVLSHVGAEHGRAVTGVGVLLGTAAYMSPEQTRGLPADRRSDIWAFGCVIYEMLTGVRLFAADTVTDTLAAVLTREPDWTRIPIRVRRLLQQCLERDPRRRLRDIGDANALLEESPSSSATKTATATLPWIIAAAAIASLMAALVLLWPAPVDRRLVRLALDLGGTAPENVLVHAAVSSDGSRLVFHARDKDGRTLLATRRFDEATATLLTGTEGADQPFFSPDGQWIGFFAGNDLRKVPVQGGTPVRLAGVRTPRGASWGDDDKIVAALTNSAGLSVLAADGGAARSLTTVSPDDPTHRWPQVLPGAKAVIFTANAPTLNSYEDATIDVQSLETGQRKTVWRGGYSGRYVPTERTRGHLVYVRGGVLFAAPFDPVRLEIEGTPARLLEDLAADAGSAAGRFDFSRTGTFIYQSGTGQLPWAVGVVDETGKTELLLTKPALYYSPRFSPDGQRVAIGIDNGKGQDIYVYDRQRDVPVQLTYGMQQAADPVWSSDGTHLFFRTYGASPALWWVRTDGTGQPVRLVDARTADIGPDSLSPDGRVLIYSAPVEDGSEDMWTMALDLADIDRPKAAMPQPFFHTAANESRPAFSPDGRWVAYQSNESGSAEIYVRPYAGAASTAAGKWQISTGGGTEPMWSRSGRHLFYIVRRQLMVTEYQSAGGRFVAGKPRAWATLPPVGDTGFSKIDVAPDGTRVVVLMRSQPDENAPAPRTNLLLNFFDEIRRLSPSK